MSKMRYTWTPASEPPDTARDVVLWSYGNGLWVGYFFEQEWHAYGSNNALRVTHWRDVEPPTEGKG